MLKIQNIPQIKYFNTVVTKIKRKINVSSSFSSLMKIRYNDLRGWLAKSSWSFDI